MAGHSGHPATVMHQPGYTSFPPPHLSEEYLFNPMGVNDYATTTTAVPLALAEYQHPANSNTYCTMSGVNYPFWDYHSHPEYYAPAQVHNTPFHHTPAGSFPRYTYECPSYPEYIDSRSGSFSSLSSIGSASSHSSSYFSEYSTMSNPVYPDLAYHHPDQSERQSSYPLRNSPMHNSEVIDIVQQPGPGASFIYQTSQSVAVPAPMFQLPYGPARPLFRSHASAPQPIAAPAHHHLLEEQPHSAVFGVEQQLQPIHQYAFAQVDTIPQHEPHPYRSAQATLFVDESPQQPSAPPSAKLSTPLKSPNLESLARKYQRGPVSTPPTVTSAPTAAASPTQDDDEALLLRASTGAFRRPWPCKYEDQVFTSEDMKLPAVKRRRIYINSLEQACNQMHALLQQHGLLPPRNRSPRPAYLPRTLKPKETKLSIIKAQYETTILRERLAFLTEMEKASVSDEPLLHPHSDSTLA